MLLIVVTCMFGVGFGIGFGTGYVTGKHCELLSLYYLCQGKLNSTLISYKYTLYCIYMYVNIQQHFNIFSVCMYVYMYVYMYVSRVFDAQFAPNMFQQSFKTVDADQNQ